MKDWTQSESALHKEGQRLLQQARDQRKERLKREAYIEQQKKTDALIAQLEADKKAERDDQLAIAAFMKDVADSLKKHDLQMAPNEPSQSYAMRQLPLFKLVRTRFKADYYQVYIRPGQGWNWSK